MASRLDRLEWWVSRPLGYASAFTLLAMTAITMLDVALRYVGVSLPGAAEVTENLMVFCVFFSLAHTQAENSNVSMDFVVHALPAGLRRIGSLASKLVCLGFTLALFAGTGRAALKSLEIGEYRISSFELPIWPSKFAVSAAFLMLAMEFAIQLVREISHGGPLPVAQKVTDA